MDMKKLVEELYMIEDEKDYREASTKMLSIAVKADHASMLRAIADRFGQSLSSFAAEILENAVDESFLYLSDRDKSDLAEKADKETSEYLEKRGVKITNWDSAGETVGSRHWQQRADMWLEHKADKGAEG